MRILSFKVNGPRIFFTLKKRDTISDSKSYIVADLGLLNCRFVTMDEDDSIAEAVAVKFRRIT
ncbi:MAG: hypothetical protein QGF78_01035 [Candidatus Bathyarchaeota archaeon]|jgi:hypothetical protein|nr:hypothetical protein [Candidatus Bathyarchaeota archaeon]|tara:strand:- start:19 stop:207 length:189 start_codon:yes stop_codon:yes gene_type:complete